MGVGCVTRRRYRPDRRMVVAVAAMTALAGGGCGPGDSHKVAAGASTTPTRSVEQDRAVASRGLLTPADVPSLVTAPPPDLNRFYARCAASSLLPGGDDPRAAAPTGYFKDESAALKRVQITTVASYSALGLTEEAARVAVATLRSPEFRNCLERELKNAVNGAAGRQVASGISTAELVAPILGDEVVTFRTTLTGPGGVYQSLDLTTVRKGRAVVSVTAARMGTVPFPDDERVRLVGLVANRLGG